MPDLNKNCLLSTAYWGPLQYFTKFLLYPEIAIEQFETYPKQTYRNRCILYGPNGVQSLHIPVEAGSFHRILTKDIGIAWHMQWQKNHLTSIQTAYKSAPFYEYYIDDIIPFYSNKYKFLIDYNLQINTLCLKWLKIDTSVKLTHEFEKNPNADDFRFSISPKVQKQDNDLDFNPIPYHQVFIEKYGFLANLSILDLIMNCGPESKSILKNSIANHAIR